VLLRDIPVVRVRDGVLPSAQRKDVKDAKALAVPADRAVLPTARQVPSQTRIVDRDLLLHCFANDG
jgi:hypothetical protein